MKENDKFPQKICLWENSLCELSKLYPSQQNTQFINFSQTPRQFSISNLSTLTYNYSVWKWDITSYSLPANSSLSKHTPLLPFSKPNHQTRCASICFSHTFSKILNASTNSLFEHNLSCMLRRGRKGGLWWTSICELNYFNWFSFSWPILLFSR